MRSRTAGPVRLVLMAALALAAPMPTAKAQPDPAVTPAQLHVDSVEVNLTAHPAFKFAVLIPTVLRFESGEASGQRYLHIWAYSRVDSLQTRITRAASYQAERPGIFTPLIEPPNTEPVLGNVERLEFRRAVEQALRDPRPERTMSYHRRLSSHST